MRIPPLSPFTKNTSYILGTLLCISACGPDSLTTNPHTGNLPPPSNALVALTCTGNIQSSTLACQIPSLTPLLSKRTNLFGGNSSGVDQNIIGGQNINIRLTSSNVSYDPGTEIFQFDVTVQNLLKEALGSINGVTPDTGGIKVFFHQPPAATSGSGIISVVNKDGTGAFTSSNQDYYKYAEILTTGQVSASKTWQFSIPSTVNTFAFTVYVEAALQTFLVINEVLVNPGGTITDANGEWFEVYNAGSQAVEMQGLLIADSANSGRRPYHVISSSLIVPPGGYVTLGETTNTTINGGAPVDYAYGSALTLANSLDAIKISRVVGTDTITIDYVRYGSVTSAQNGISRELKNPSLDNLNIDGTNWADAAVTSVYGPGGRGTPKAQNSTFVP